MHALKSLWKCWTRRLWTETNQHEAYQYCIGSTSGLINLKLPVFLIGTDTNQHHLNIWVQILSFRCWPRLHCFDFGQDHSIKATLSWLWSRPYRCDSGESPTTQFGLLGPRLYYVLHADVYSATTQYLCLNCIQTFLLLTGYFFVCLSVPVPLLVIIGIMLQKPEKRRTEFGINFVPSTIIYWF